MIEATVPNRLQYFDEQGLDWSPYMQAVALPAVAAVILSALLLGAGTVRRRG